MSTVKTTSYENFSVDDVLTYVRYDGGLRALKVLRRPFIDAVSEYRFIVQWGMIKDNAFVEDKPANLEVKSTFQLRDVITHRWTADVKPVRTPVKGNVYKDPEGNLYLATSDTKLWSLTKGTWSTVKDLDSVPEWGTWGGTTTKRIVLKDVKDVVGDTYGQKLS